MEDVTECVYKVPCDNCEKIYVRETKRKLGVRLQEHRSEVESKTKREVIAHVGLTEYNKSALTDHATHENYMIHWTKAAVIDVESDRPTR